MFVHSNDIMTNNIYSEMNFNRIPIQNGSVQIAPPQIESEFCVLHLCLKPPSPNCLGIVS